MTQSLGWVYCEPGGGLFGWLTVIELGLQLLDVIRFPGDGVQHDLQLLVQLSIHLVTLADLLLLVNHLRIQLPL